MSYFTEVLWPYLLLGAVASAAIMLYQMQFNKGKSVYSYINNAIESLLKIINLSGSDGLGHVIKAAIQFFIVGLIIGISVYITNQFAPIPTPGAVLPGGM